MTMDLSDKKVTVIGAGRSGQAAARLIHTQKGCVKVSEQGELEMMPDEFKRWMKEQGIGVESGGHTKKFIQDSDLVILSPGVRRDAVVVRWAEEKKIPVWSEVELAWNFCPIPIIAVTGSNGKTTVATLISEVIADSGKKSCLCGNIGTAFCEHIAHINDYDYLVLEVSSFQLESTIHFKPFIAVFLNFSQNHLDHHQNMDDYFDAKKRIFSNQDKNDYAVLNSDDSKIKGIAADVNANVRYFGLSGKRARDNGHLLNPNHQAVYAVAEILCIDRKMCDQTFKKFKGVEHRLEWVATIDGVDFINDSKSTTTESGRWAIENIDQPIIMICGGRDKNIDFQVIENLIKKRVKTLVVFGESRDKIKKAYQKIVEVQECDQLETAVRQARACSSPGDCILLSPMCTSFDSFANFEERGKAFKTIVSQLN